MKTRLIKMAIALFAVTWLAVAQTMAAEAVEGTIESAGSGKISIKDKNGTVRRFDVDSAAKITLDGKAAKLDALGVGSTASITTESKNNKTVAVMIEARSKLKNSTG
jgi:hypothetical protein